MTVRAKLLQKILDKLDKLPEGKLEEILKYIEGLEELSETQAFFLSFAGSWKDLDESLFSEFTDQLHKRRNQENRPID
ncbi:MAG: hypothetical protein AAFP19_19930 [Bacteroidota bacterium]